MNSMHYVYMVCFALLAINKDIREVCLIYLVTYLFYLNFILNVSDDLWYYRLCACMALITGFLIIRKSFIVGCLSLSLIPVNLIGVLLYRNYYPPTIYDNMALTVIFLQVLILSIRTLNGILNESSRSGIFGRTIRLFMVRITDADSLAKNKKTLEKVV